MSVNCERCGRFGARRVVLHLAHEHASGRRTETYYVCHACEQKILADTGKRPAYTAVTRSQP